MPQDINKPSSYETDEFVPAAEPPAHAAHLPLDRAVETQAVSVLRSTPSGEAYARALKGGAAAETQPRLDYAPYRSSILRHPTKSLHHADPETIELYSPAFGHQDVHALEADLTIQHNGEPQGERIIVAGKVLDGDGRPVAGQLVEIWQANSSGRYIHKRDQHPAPLDPNFTGVGRCITGPDGSYRFTTIKPGAYPWKNHLNAWRPAHIHFSLFGTSSPSASSPRCTSRATSSSRWTPSTSPSWTRTPATASWPPTTTTSPSPSGPWATTGTSS